jgi:hypothetical protein
MANCQSLLERFFGYQTPDTGAVRAYARAGSIIGKANYTPTNPLKFTPELGNIGAAYSMDARTVAPQYYRSGYGGVLPVTQQPQIKPPEAYTLPVLF